jgi:hypothetical protein
LIAEALAVARVNAATKAIGAGFLLVGVDT